MSRWKRLSSERLIATTLVLFATSVGGMAGCEVITKPDRSDIGGAGGAGGAGGEGGTSCTPQDDNNDCTTDACSETTDACTFDMIAGCMLDGGPALDGGVTDDAGSADAGAGTTDSGVGSVDARGDAGPARDVGPVDAAGGLDAGESPDTGLGGAAGGSCGCRVGGTPTNTRALMLLATIALGIAARRRRAR